MEPQEEQERPARAAPFALKLLTIQELETDENDPLHGSWAACENSLQLAEQRYERDILPKIEAELRRLETNAKREGQRHAINLISGKWAKFWTRRQ